MPRARADPPRARDSLTEIEALLLDVEGTTTPIDFVTRTLFPFARRHVAAFLAAHLGDEAVAGDLARLRTENAVDVARDGAPFCSGATGEAVRYVFWLMDQDRKSTALKALQGRIWEEGYLRGELRGEVYDDVPPAFRRWKRDGRRIAIFSSGSVLAQQLLFRHSTAGDLAPFLSAHFDTTTGAKREPGSYALIADRLGAPSSAVFFVSDVAEEVDAARTAGMETALCVRDNAFPEATHRVIRSFDALP